MKIEPGEKIITEANGRTWAEAEPDKGATGTNEQAKRTAAKNSRQYSGYDYLL
jgi:hypothetical protein